MGVRALSIASAFLLLCCGSASAQLDPLLFLKGAKPRVLIALDLSSRMQRDLLEEYRDPYVYQRTGAAWEDSLGLAGSSDVQYRRAFTALCWLDPGGQVRATADSVRVVGDLQVAFSTFDAATRLGLVRAALSRAVRQNLLSVSFGLVPSRQAAAAFQSTPTGGVEVSVFPGASSETDTGTSRVWRARLGEGDAPGASLPASPALVHADAAGPNARLLEILSKRPMEGGGLVPAGVDTSASVDAPLLALLDDTLAEAARLIEGDAECRNTIVVLLAGGGQQPDSAAALHERAGRFLRVAGRRVPVYVIGLAPGQSGAELRSLAFATGATYVEVAPPNGATPDESLLVAGTVRSIVRAINSAVQHAFARHADVNALPSVDLPFGPRSDFTVSAPVVGTINLEQAVGADGGPLPRTRVTTPDGVVVEQKSNVMITAGFCLPGFEARVSATRMYVPEPDATKATGFRFVADGTKLWSARAPTAGRRNIFTALPGRGLVPFTIGSLDLLSPHLRVADAARLIEEVRALPLGAATNSTPALLTAPPDAHSDNGYAAFAALNRDRRSLVFVGLDDGMMHALDARTGIEVWAFVPFNLLPRLRLLLEGQPIDQYHYYVGGSARLADVRDPSGWKTIMVFGEGPGGTFYQAFDVTLAGVGGALPATQDSADALLGYFSDPAVMPFLWSFPPYSQFDASLGEEGEMRPEAGALEMTVGHTWSTPAIFSLPGTAFSALVVGSGPLASSVEKRSRGGAVAGTTLYLLDAGTGTVLDARSVGSDGVGEDDEACLAAACGGFKNALAADAAVLLAGEQHEAQAYLGDLDGRLWRATVRNGQDGVRLDGAPRLLYRGSASEPVFAAVGLARPGFGRTLVFFGTGSDMVQPAAGTSPGRLVGLLDSASGVTTAMELDLAQVPGGGERLSGAPAIGGDVVFFATTLFGRTPCDASEGRIYCLTLGGGFAYDANGDGRRDASDRMAFPLPDRARLTAPTVAGQHVFVAEPGRVRVLGDPERFNQGVGFAGVRILGWREVRD